MAESGLSGRKLVVLLVRSHKEQGRIPHSGEKRKSKLRGSKIQTKGVIRFSYASGSGELEGGHIANFDF